MSYHHLTMSERECILRMHHNQKDITQIAQTLGRSKSTISRELHRNTGRTGYSAHEAQNSYTIPRQACKPHLKVMRPERQKHIISGLEQYWSPEQIIGHHGMSLCTTTIYRALKNGWLPTVLREKLRQQGKSHKAEGEERRGTIPDCISKGKRSTEAAARSRVGDWEGDTVAGKC
ncbi:IS30 family transposase [Candidatus Cryosericum septentrionale]|uniref:IS30 family transposase n=1 Tax=Candidatus Cryosericum septentrionale TaxID=2290913 RepID=A0A398DWF7_9BACT|nr:IS30 family transposase [Candidatus Cryosericum septentrionale]RIE15624.1 IS30 family transposase [Candidatus Cryosericum septentrionale]